MKVFSKFSIVILIIGITALFYSCGDTVATGDIPEISMSIPAALTSEASRTAPKATSAGGTAEDFFEPFRNSLEIAEELLTGIKDIIASLNATVVPDAWTGTQDNGDSVVVTTDTGRDYSKRIEFTSSGAASPYLQINYNPGAVKGIIYYTEEDATSSLENIKAFYDETGTYPVLKIWLTIIEGSAGDTYPVSLYFNATMNADGNYVIDGGASYNFVFGGHETWTNDYTSNRTYMFKAFANSDGTKAKVALYFPLSSVTAVDESHNIKNAFLDILFQWIEIENTEDIDDLLVLTEGTVTDGISLGDALAGMDEADIPDDVGFVISMTNPIAYDSFLGYVGNATTYPTDSAYALGDTGALTFTLSPLAIEALDSAPGTTFTFLAD